MLSSACLIECLERRMKLNWFLMKLYNIKVKVYFNELRKKHFKWESLRPRPFFSPGGTGRPAHLRFLYSQVCPGARPAAATPAVQPPCQHTRHLSDHFRASTLPKGAGRRECHISLNNSRNLNKLVVFNEKICF